MKVGDTISDHKTYYVYLAKFDIELVMHKMALKWNKRVTCTSLYVNY